MAGKARKDLAKSNAEKLKNLHLVSLALNSTFILVSLLTRSRSLPTYFILSAPAFGAQYVLETSGRPKYTTLNGKTSLRTAGEDLGAPGLTEYMFDVIWVTWACLISALMVGNKGWWLYAVVPAFAVWKGWGLLGAARGMMGAGRGAQLQGQEDQQPAMNRKQRRAAA